MNKKKILIAVGIIVLIIAAAAPSYYYYTQYQKAQSTLKDPAKAAREELATVTTPLSKIMELPKDETPTLATVTDKSKLKEQPFFVHAEIGDKVLIYTVSKKAILYRPSSNKVIEVGPINIAPQNSATPSAEIKQATQSALPAKIAIYNGTNTRGLTGAAEKKLKDELKTAVEIVAKENASKFDYAKTLMIDLTESNNISQPQIKQQLNAEIVPLPEGETKPEDADYLIILGSDFK
jgi:hypothetical protein